ncbi:MAG: hypothetical protein BGN91_15315 [Nitrobacter sp. 62-13]|nr:MAG: hypothetical protein BGN91_15315 [Nitrobacter sp. 62-13]
MRNPRRSNSRRLRRPPNRATARDDGNGRPRTPRQLIKPLPALRRDPLHHLMQNRKGRRRRHPLLLALLRHSLRMSPRQRRNGRGQ